MDDHLATPAQRLVCERFRVTPFAAPADLKVGVAPNIKDGVWPLNGLRHPPEGDTTGWYIWAGEELSEAPDFFEPLHVGHLAERCPAVLPYLALPPGWRFLLAPDFEDVWQDPTLLTP
ncbi:MAG: hypothetical protein ABR600_11395 [Actinomycetota bacterium]